ncbi:hypothetical protein HML84_14270 [Alcanivorax sp. IO_7]|nr:hypothetical protein HML84_14270 [Alcanivorax sp. IO_7]
MLRVIASLALVVALALGCGGGARTPVTWPRPSARPRWSTWPRPLPGR